MSEYFKGERHELKEYIPRNIKTVLEVGCGEGGFRQFFAYDVEYWGIEPNPQAMAIASSKLTKVLHGIYDEVSYQLPKKYFDLIVCNDVIEHMQDPKIFLQAIKNVMSENSKLLISIPNVRYLTNIYELLVKKDWQYREAGILDYTHLRFFTKKSFENLLVQEGYKINFLQGINQPKDKPYKPLIFAIAGIVLGSDIKYPQFVLLVEPIKS